MGQGRDGTLWCCLLRLDHDMMTRRRRRRGKKEEGTR